MATISPIPVPGLSTIPDLATRSIWEIWPEFTAELAERELAAAGWKPQGKILWRASRNFGGELWAGPAGAWKRMRKMAAGLTLG